MQKQGRPRQTARAQSGKSPIRDRVEVDFLILADAAQEVKGKLYLLGGGWNVYRAQSYPATFPFGLAAGILIPWSETNRLHAVGFVIKASEGVELLKGEAQVEVGREAGLSPGITQRVVLAIQGQLKIPQPGTYEVILQTAEDTKRTTFEALLIPTGR